MEKLMDHKTLIIQKHSIIEYMLFMDSNCTINNDVNFLPYNPVFIIGEKHENTKLGRLYIFLLL